MHFATGSSVIDPLGPLSSATISKMRHSSSGGRSGGIVVMGYRSLRSGEPDVPYKCS